MKDLKGIKGKFYIARLIEEGEHEHQDFKFAISDARKIARSISAFANNDGGRLLVGVKDNGVIAGVRNEEDIYVVEQAAEIYCRPSQHIEVTAFRTEGDKTVFRIDIARAQRRPVCVKEADGSFHAYYRVGDENILAPPLMLRVWREDMSDRGHTIALSESGRCLLSMLERQKMIIVEDYMTEARISRATAEDSIIRLHSMKLIEFHYDGKAFRLRLKTDDSLE